ncbi:armadillo-type protein [Halteromyces radiatus]|uniref:armadillo-type protein n=1 Tax=Halteromyces radiatus TaxID=101107 RepID=UPI002221233E|nr:armadillo-type protein [Halteromyces radiatus]KAI8081290.1 armadillo-type protein [Halteromyces radiatus]
MPDKPNHRHLYKRTSISGSSDDIRRRRQAINDTLRKKHREQLITTKRYRHLTRREEQSAGESETDDDTILAPDNEHDEDIDPYYRLNTAQVQSLAQDLKSTDKKIRLDAIHYLAKFVVEPAEALMTYIVEGNCMETLTHLLSSAEVDEQIEVVKTISNIAAGAYDLWAKSICMVPYLITLLDSENNVLREMAAGALGNMAAEDLGDMTNEDDEVRARIRNNGAILPLVRMLDSEEPRTVQYACFALANLARGDEASLQSFIAAGIDKHLLHHLLRETADTVTEICWVMSFLTAGSKEFRDQVMQEGFIQPLVKNLNNSADQGPIVLPILRTFGNLAAGPDENTELLIQQQPFLSTLLKLLKSDSRVIKKETLWVMSNITTANRAYIIEQVDTPETIAQLSDMVQTGHFEIRKGAAICLLNIAHHGQKFMDNLNHRTLLKAFLDFIKSQDAELIRLGLGYVQMLLTRVSKGKEILDDTPSCMDALASVNPAPDPELYALANQIVDQYYDEKEDLPSMDEA